MPKSPIKKHKVIKDEQVPATPDLPVENSDLKHLQDLYAELQALGIHNISKLENMIAALQ